MDKIEAGDKVKDIVTGFEGIVIAVTHWLNGCTRMGVQSDVLKDGLPTDTIWFDEPQLSLVETGKVKRMVTKPGGPTQTPKRAKDPIR